jgi:hypothetical protein
MIVLLTRSITLFGKMAIANSIGHIILRVTQLLSRGYSYVWTKEEMFNLV